MLCRFLPPRPAEEVEAAQIVAAPPAPRLGCAATGRPTSRSPRPPVRLVPNAFRRIHCRSACEPHRPAGRKVNVRRKTDSLSPDSIVDFLAKGDLFIAYQRTTRAAQPAGADSRTWFGNRDATEWVHSSGVAG